MWWNNDKGSFTPHMIAIVIICRIHPADSFFILLKWFLKNETTVSCSRALASTISRTSTSNCFGLSDLNGWSRTFGFTKFKNPLFYYWNWCCRDCIVFINYILDILVLSDFFQWWLILQQLIHYANLVTADFKLVLVFSPPWWKANIILYFIIIFTGRP